MTHRAAVLPYGHLDRVTCSQKLLDAKYKLVHAGPSCIQLNDVDCVEDVMNCCLFIRQMCAGFFRFPPSKAAFFCQGLTRFMWGRLPGRDKCSLACARPRSADAARRPMIVHAFWVAWNYLIRWFGLIGAAKVI